MKVLVTGATGFLGPIVIRDLKKSGYSVKVLIRDPQKLKKLNVLVDEVVVGDVVDIATLANIAKGCDYVVHLAVLGHVYEDNVGLEDYRRVNVQGTKNLLESIREEGVKKIICISSSAAVGLVDDSIITEDVICNPQTPYGVSKMESDNLIRTYVEKYRMPIVTLRFTHVYGPGDTRDFLKIVKMIKRGIFPVVGFGPNLYPAVYKEDASKSILLALDKGHIGEIYNITNDKSHDLREIARLVRKELNINIPQLWIPKDLSILILKLAEKAGLELPVKSKNLKFVTSARRYSIDKARKDMDYSPSVSIEQGIKETVKYYLDNNLL